MPDSIVIHTEVRIRKDTGKPARYYRKAFIEGNRVYHTDWFTRLSRAARASRKSARRFFTIMTDVRLSGGESVK